MHLKTIGEVMSYMVGKQTTYQDILDLPENMIGEIINGQLETHPRHAPNIQFQENLEPGGI